MHVLDVCIMLIVQHMVVCLLFFLGQWSEPSCIMYLDLCRVSLLFVVNISLSTLTILILFHLTIFHWFDI